jgi:hypothetical protein
VWLHENDEIPCDLVLIGTSDPQGICYVEVNMSLLTNIRYSDSMFICNRSHSDGHGHA